MIEIILTQSLTQKLAMTRAIRESLSSDQDQEQEARLYIHPLLAVRRCNITIHPKQPHPQAQAPRSPNLSRASPDLGLRTRWPFLNKKWKRRVSLMGRQSKKKSGVASCKKKHVDPPMTLPGSADARQRRIEPDPIMRASRSSDATFPETGPGIWSGRFSTVDKLSRGKA